MRFDTILFDLDGTLTDSGPGITNAIAYALERQGMPVPPREALYRFIGPPLIDEFQRAYGVSREQAVALTDQFRVYFVDRGIFENSPYNGVREMLSRLKRAGLFLTLATSKPEAHAEQVLEHFDLRRYFDAVAGSAMDETRTNKAEVIAYALEKSGRAAAGAVMVGDRRHDVDGAKAHGIPTIGVLYGYGSREELTEAGAAILAETPEAVADLLLRP